MKITFTTQTTTPWFDSEEPAHEGVYERHLTPLYAVMPLYAYWDGEHWYQAAHSPERARSLYEMGYRTDYSLTDFNHRWRGLTQRP